MSAPELPLFAEIFPVRPESVPSLTAYRLRMDEGAVQSIAQLERKLGGKLVYRLNAMLPGRWVWVNSLVLTDVPPNPARLAIALAEARAAMPTFAPIALMEEVHAFTADAALLAEYIVRGPLDALSAEINAALARSIAVVPNARAEREFRARAHVVEDQPAVSISILSRLIATETVEGFAARLGRITDLVGYAVMDPSSTLQGEISKIIGPLSEHRTRLLALTQREEMAQRIASAPDDHWVVRVQTSTSEYDFVSDALQIIIRLDDVERFGIRSEDAERALHMRPTQRAAVVKLASDVLKAHGLIGDAYNSNNAPGLFSSAAPDARLRFGADRTRAFSSERASSDVQAAGLFRWHDDEPEHGPHRVRITLINTLSDAVDDFIEAMRRMAVKHFNTTFEIVRERRMRVSSQANLESAVRLLAALDADLMLVFLPDSAGASDEDGVSDVSVKAQTIGRGQPCLIVHERTMNQPEAMASIIIGSLARAGASPFILEEPLPFADRIVGCTLARVEKRGAEDWFGFTRIYRADGLLLGACLSSQTRPPGAHLTDSMLEALFPRALLEHKRVVLHTDGRYRREIMRALGGWEDELGASFYPVEISQRSAPRMYAFRKGAVEPAPWGAEFRMNAREALLVTTHGRDEGTPMPLFIRAEPPLEIDQAVRSVMAFMLFHYGALTPPRLPVTLHHGEVIVAGAGRGVLPDSSAFQRPFWL
jgi:hypothetical protein